MPENAIKNESLRLRIWFLLPLAVAMLTTVVFLVLSVHRHVEEDIARQSQETAHLAEHLYQEKITESANMLGAAIAALGTDEVMHAALAQKDRAKLLELSAPLFSQLRAKYAVTHMYFSSVDRINILRVHQPERFGDVIDRDTTLQAQKSAQVAYGVELGPLGTLTLRLVQPWTGADGRLLGFVELGMEIDHVLRTVQHIGNVKTFVLLNKARLNRPDWEAGLRMLGRTPHWEQFPEVVLNNQATEDIPSKLNNALQRSGGIDKRHTASMINGAFAYQAIFMPLNDAASKPIGSMVMLLDVSGPMEALSRMTWQSGLVGGAAGALLLILFYWLLGKIGRRLDRDKKRLQDLAEHDGLTGLYNHRMYYLKLDDEFVRRQRNQAPVSVLLLDIDRFKSVNDRYGHLTGDMVLKTLANIVMQSCRAMDVACRYGGEEVTVILPETDMDGAMVIAERLRKTVEEHSFDLGGMPGHITISIGVATSSEEVESAKTLTDNADGALYRAKESGRNRVVSAEQAVQV